MPNQIQQHDATADFHAALSDPTRWVIKRGVPIFKPHQRTDPATGNLIKVDVPKLYRIAANMQRLEKQGGVPIRLTLGHTEPGKPETEQPPIGGYYRNARVQPFGPSGEPAVVVDEWLDPQYLPERKNFPYRSSEYYDDAEQITGVALLTRDPYLDLGVVAYSRVANGSTHYARTATGVTPTVYQFLIAGDSEMYPSTPPVPAAPPSPTPYGSWSGEGSGYNPSQTIPHPHTNTGAIYGQQPMPMPPGMPPAGMPGQPQPPVMNGGMPPGMPEEEGEEAGLYALHHHLGQAVEHLSRHLAGKKASKYGAAPGAPTAPFPPEQQPGSGPTPNSRYAAEPNPMDRNKPETPEEYARRYHAEQARNYGRGAAPAANMARTISGLPVGYQMQVDTLQFKLNETQRAMQVLLYERDQADTEWCVSEIRRLRTIGFAVDDSELQELKNKPRDQREAYLQRICAKYARVPAGEMPPPIMGDPTPGMAENTNRPATQAEMEMALKMAAGTNDPNGYQNALHYIRTNGGAAPGGVNRLAALPARNAAPAPMPGEWNAGEPMPGSFTDPYPEPTRNGW